MASDLLDVCLLTQQIPALQNSRQLHLLPMRGFKQVGLLAPDLPISQNMAKLMNFHRHVLSYMQLSGDM